MLLFTKTNFRFFLQMSRVCYERFLQWYLYTPPRKVPFYVQNVVFILLMKAALVLLRVALVLLVFKSSKSYGLLMLLVIIVVVLEKHTFVPLTLVSRPGVNLVTSPNFHCELGNLSTVSLTLIIGKVVGNLFGLCVSLRLHKHSFCHLFQKWLKILFNNWDS